MDTITKSNKETKSADGKMKTGISAKNKEKVANELNGLLADEMTLYVKTLNFHWNIEGDGFHALHVFLEEQYTQLQNLIDGVAERVRKIGHFATGSMKEFLGDTSLKEKSGGKITPDMLAALAADHDTIIRKTREMINRFEDEYEDAGSADFVTGLMQEHEKMSWMLHSSIK